MAQSVKLKDGSYIDAGGVYDATQGKTQEAVNAAQATTNTSVQTFMNKFELNSGTAGLAFCWFNDNGVLELRFKTKNDGNFRLHFHTKTKQIKLWKYDSSGSTLLWTFT